MSRLLDEILQAQKRGQVRGLPSICSAHPWVLRVALRGENPVLIESTCNQVNQYGGYTDMRPADFAGFVRGLAAENGFPIGKLLIGGDHLGPSPWQAEPSALAMEKAAGLVQACVQAGYTKIHLDASMRLGDDDPAHPLDLDVAARRTARLAAAAEAAAGNPADLGYVIGTEVPLPGGAAMHADAVQVTRVEDARRTLTVTQAAFLESGLESAWERVVALVVQPGVEFGDDFVLDYDPARARDLARFSETTPIIYEAHSTDYQRRENLRQLVHDHFAILKVGPALTFAFREAAFALAAIEAHLFPPARASHLPAVLEKAMLDRPEHWQRYYPGTAEEQAIKRRFSRSDRLRYYWAHPEVRAAFQSMLDNLGREPLPAGLIEQHASWLAGVPRTAADVLTLSLQRILEDYTHACTGAGGSGGRAIPW